MTYEKWIKDYVERHKGYVYGRCRDAAHEMAATFHELRVEAGHVIASWGRSAHWWCVDPEGRIVDPTAAQFDLIFEYIPFTPGSRVRVSKCMECGEDIWAIVQSLNDQNPVFDPGAGFYFCSEICNERLTEAYG